MNTEELRANLTNDELIARAAAAGWAWCEDNLCNGYRFTGWAVTDCHHINCKPEAKAETLRGKAGIHPGFDHHIDCRECGRPIWLAWRNDEELVKHRECFNCNHWMGLVRRLGPNSVVAGDGGAADGPRRHYKIGPKKIPHYCNGFGGDWWTVTFDDGREVETCDLWSQGDVPERFWDRLPINAALRSGRGV